MLESREEDHTGALRVSRLASWNYTALSLACSNFGTQTLDVDVNYALRKVCEAILRLRTV
jgi:hypothetical protein